MPAEKRKSEDDNNGDDPGTEFRKKLRMLRMPSFFPQPPQQQDEPNASEGLGASRSEFPPLLNEDRLKDCEEIEIIDPDGDVYLKYSKPDEYDEDEVSTGAFLASSKALSLASPVFRRTFEPDSPFFQNKTADGKYHVCWIYSTYRAAVIALNIIHLRRSRIPEDAMALDLLHELAVFADQYQCAGSLEAQVDICLRNSEVYRCFGRAHVPELGKWLMVAYVFEVKYFYDYVLGRLLLEGVWEKSDEDEKWRVLVPGDLSSMKTDYVVTVHQRVPNSLLETLRVNTDHWSSTFANLTHSFVKEHYLSLHSYTVTQNIYDPQESANQARYKMQWKASAPGLWTRLVQMTGLRLEHIGSGKRISASNIHEFSRDDIVACQSSSMTCSIQRFLDAVALFEVEAPYCGFDRDDDGSLSILRPARRQHRRSGNPDTAREFFLAVKKAQEQVRGLKWD